MKKMGVDRLPTAQTVPTERRVGARTRSRRGGLLLAGTLAAASGGLGGCSKDKVCDSIGQVLSVLQENLNLCCTGGANEEFCYNYSSIASYLKEALFCYLQGFERASDADRRDFFKKVLDQVPDPLQKLLGQSFRRLLIGAHNVPPNILVAGFYGEREGLAYNTLSPFFSSNTTIALNITAIPTHITLASIVDTISGENTMSEEAGDGYTPPDAGPTQEENNPDFGGGPTVTPPISAMATQYTLVAPSTAIDVTGGASPGSYTLSYGTMGIADFRPHPEGGLHAVPSEFNALFVNGGTGDSKTAVVLELDRTCPYNIVTVRPDGVGVFAARMHMTTFNRSLPSVSDVLPTVWIELPLDFADAQSPITISTPQPVPGQALLPWRALADDADTFRVPNAAQEAGAQALLPEIDPGPCVITISSVLGGLELTQQEGFADLDTISVNYYGSQIDCIAQPNPGNPPGGGGGGGGGNPSVFFCAFLDPSNEFHPSKWWKRGDPVPEGSWPIDLNPNDGITPYNCQCVGGGGDLTKPPGRGVRRPLAITVNSLLTALGDRCRDKIRIDVPFDLCPPAPNP